MSDKVFQVVIENQFEVEFEETTLEECIDVVYTSMELREMYNNGELFTDFYDFRCMSKKNCTSLPTVANSSYSIEVILKPDNIVNHVISKFKNPKTKEVFIEFGTSALERMVELNPFFKQYRFRFSPAKGGFIRWKAPKKPKPIAVPYLLNDLRGRTIDKINKIIATRFDLQLELKYVSEKKEQLKVVKFGAFHGIDLDFMLNLKGFSGNGHRVLLEEEGKSKWVLNQDTVESYLKEALTTSNKLDSYELTLQAYKDWYKEGMELELPVE